MSKEIRDLYNEVDCRIEHGVESGGHLEYVRKKLGEIKASIEGKPEEGWIFHKGADMPVSGDVMVSTELDEYEHLTFTRITTSPRKANDIFWGISNNIRRYRIVEEKKPSWAKRQVDKIKKEECRHESRTYTDNHQARKRHYTCKDCGYKWGEWQWVEEKKPEKQTLLEYADEKQSYSGIELTGNAYIKRFVISMVSEYLEQRED